MRPIGSKGNNVERTLVGRPEVILLIKGIMGLGQCIESWHDGNLLKRYEMTSQMPTIGDFHHRLSIPLIETLGKVPPQPRCSTLCGGAERHNAPSLGID
jgi:hypothetical protein